MAVSVAGTVSGGTSYGVLVANGVRPVLAGAGSGIIATTASSAIVGEAPSAESLAVGALLGGAAGKVGSLRKPSVWSMGNGDRGFAIENMLGGNLPAAFRVIARFSKGEATSIKSVDLRAPTYQNPKALARLLDGYIDKLAAYKGTKKPYGGVDIQESQITGRTLQVTVPSKAMTPAQQAVFDSATQRAQAADVKLVVTPVN